MKQLYRQTPRHCVENLAPDKRPTISRRVVGEILHAAALPTPEKLMFVDIGQWQTKIDT